MQSVAVLGAGSWGTALALQLSRNGVATTLWGHDADRIAAMGRERRNARYLPDIPLPETLRLSSDLGETLADCDAVLVVTPSHAFPEVVRRLGEHRREGTPVAWATKGLEPGSGRFLHRVAAEVLGETVPTAVVSGPSFALEVAQDLPTAVTVASADAGLAARVAATLHGGRFRAYTTDDMAGVELGGAVKNVLAVATGISDGMQLGANARAALITRGLAEMMRLGAALGCRPETLMGLAGVGDLVLTCTGGLSRNRRLGMALGRGAGIAEAAAEIGQVVEGIRTSEEVARLGQQAGVELPIADQIYAILHHRRSPQHALEALLAREPKSERD